MGGTGRFVKGLDTTEKRVTHFCWARHYWNDDKAIIAKGKCFYEIIPNYMRKLLN